MPTASDKRAFRERALKALKAAEPEEERRVDAGIAADHDNPELGADFFSRAKRGRGPQKAATKRLVSLRLDPEVVERFRATGPGWQGRMNEALRKAVGL